VYTCVLSLSLIVRKLSDMAGLRRGCTLTCNSNSKDTHLLVADEWCCCYCPTGESA
jgi:hypothetical protein